MALPPDKPVVRTCPCGEEPLDSPLGQHVIGPQCRALVARHVDRRFGSRRYGGRLSHVVEDVVQECYEKLVRKGGLDSFRPSPERPLALAFRAWLFGVVRYHCHNKWSYIQSRPDLDQNGQQQKPADSPGSTTGKPLLEPLHTLSPEAAFAQEWLRSLAKAAVSDVEAEWKRKGPKWSDRFDLLLPIALELGGSQESASQALDIESNHTRQLVHVLRREVRAAVKALVRDELFLEPGTSEESIEARIEQTIQEHFDAAFPGDHRLPLDFFAPEPKHQRAKEPDQDDAPPESKP